MRYAIHVLSMSPDFIFIILNIQAKHSVICISSNYKMLQMKEKKNIFADMDFLHECIVVIIIIRHKHAIVLKSSSKNV